MTNIIDTLQTIGINEKQAKVYLATLELGKGTVGEISEKSGVKRTSVYNFLEEMKIRGLISELKENGRVVLVAAEPDTVAARAKRQYDNVKQILPELMGVFNLPGNKPKVKFYQGEDGVRTVYEDMLKTGETVYGFSDYEKMLKAVKDINLWTIPTERVKKKIKFYCIAKDGKQGRVVKQLDSKQLRETKLVDKVNFETDINIYGNKIGMISFRRPLACVIVEDVAIANTFRSIWKAWWLNLK